MSNTKIGQVRIRTDTDDPLAARMRGDAALRALDLEPPGMPARMILCIRSMADPLPGGLDLRSSHAPRATEWERAARNAIRDALYRAVRIGDGPVPAAANAVLFADRAELLACAARDALRSNGGWWWRDVIRGGLTWTHVLREWMRAPEYIPAALQLLVRSGDAVAFLRALHPAQTVELLANVLRAHALEPLGRAVVQALERAPVSRRPAAAPPLLLDAAPDALATILPSLELLEQRVFAAITLALRRAPAVVRSTLFLHEVTAWIAPPVALQTKSATAASEAASAGEAPRHQSEARASRPSRQLPSRDETASPDTTAERPASADPLPSSAHATATSASDALAPAVAPRTARKPELPAETADAAESIETIDSRHAGLFFLLNIAVALGFYDPYGREEPIALDVWDFLALTGRALVPDLEADDLWPLLAQLANRELDDLPELDEEILNRVRDALSLVVDQEDAAAFVIARPGRITLSPAHIDVTFCLAAHPIEIRVAGLDRDPGWIPAAGRHVDFHFD
jgi:hypothetical protein